MRLSYLHLDAINQQTIPARLLPAPDNFRPVKKCCQQQDRQTCRHHTSSETRDMTSLRLQTAVQQRRTRATAGMSQDLVHVQRHI